MQHEEKAFGSKVSRRVFISFILSALIPVCTIYLVSYNQISEQLDREIRQQIYRESRSLGLTVYDRLLSLEINLQIVANELHRGMSIENFRNDELLDSIFETLYITRNGVVESAIIGTAHEQPQLSARQEAHLNQGNTVLMVSWPSPGQSELYLVHDISSSGSTSGNRHLVAQVLTSYLWDLPVYEPEFACVLDSNRMPLYCTAPVDTDEITSLVNTMDIDPGNSLTFWDIADEQYGVNIWDIFLRARFLSEDISLFMAVPRRHAFISFDEFTATFPKILVITGLLVALLSISQIRKTLSPLQKLIKGTQRVSRGEYDTQVDIRSGDEFEHLANSFNEMSRNIAMQIRTISVVAEIDRLILSSLDTEYIIERLIRCLRQMVDANHIGIITRSDKDPCGGMLYSNDDPEFKKISKSELVFSPGELDEIESADDYLLLEGAVERGYLKRIGVGANESVVVFPVRLKDELAAMICLSSNRVFEDKEDVFAKLKDLSDRVAVALSSVMWEEKLYQQAHYDMLTGLPNRFLFRDRLEQLINKADREKSNIAVLFLDLDNFKRINDSYGHSAGDDLLRHVADCISEVSSGVESLARLSGDEFMIFMAAEPSHEKSVMGAEQLAQTILARLDQPFELDSREIFISPSIGIALYPRDGEVYEGLMKNTEAAMYEAKASGRNTFQFFNKKQNERLLQRLKIQNELRHAIYRHELTLYYQPKIDCTSGRVMGAEALLRWQHPEKGLIYPDEFVPDAEESGLIVSLGNWVLETACQQHKVLLDEGIKEISIALNVSHEQFRQPNVVEIIKQIINESGLPPHLVELEITESATIENIQRTVEIVEQLKALDVVVSIDDFGTGYSSLTYLQQIPMDKLKIDRSFITNIATDSNSASIVSAIIALAHSLGLSVIAEGVETQAQCDTLLKLGCDEIQGYIITQPLTAENFRLFILREAMGE